MLFGLGQELLETPRIEQVFETCLFPVAPVAMLEIGSNDGGGNGNTFLGREEDAAVAGEILVAGDSAELHAKVNARLTARRAGAYRDKANVVGVFERADRPAAVESDVELARQAVHFAVV